MFIDKPPGPVAIPPHDMDGPHCLGMEGAWAGPCSDVRRGLSWRVREGLGHLAVTVLRLDVLRLSRAWTALLADPRRGVVAR